MDLNELMEKFAATAEIKGCAPDGNGVYWLSVDDMELRVFATDDGHVAFSADVGEPPPGGVETRECFYRTLLEAMHLGRGSAGASFSIDGSSGTVCLHRTEALSALDFESFKSMMGHFVDTLAEWRKIAADFRPVAEKRALEENARRQGARDMAANGFMQV